MADVKSKKSPRPVQPFKRLLEDDDVWAAYLATLMINKYRAWIRAEYGLSCLQMAICGRAGFIKELLKEGWCRPQIKARLEIEEKWAAEAEAQSEKRTARKARRRGTKRRQAARKARTGKKRGKKGGSR